MTSSTPSSSYSLPKSRTSCWPTPKLLAQFGPTLGRPRVDTLQGSRHANMKEFRFDAAGGVWRVAFAFDRVRRVGVPRGGKQGG